MPTNSATQLAVMRNAENVRRAALAGGNPVLSGDFDRFISSLARMVAADIYVEFGHDDEVTVREMQYWHGNPDERESITGDRFEAMCSAHGIPQNIIVENAVSGRDYFDAQYSAELFDLLGWVPTP